MGGRHSAAKDEVVEFSDGSPKAKGMVAPDAEVLLHDYSSIVLLSLRCEGLRKGRNTVAVVYSKLGTDDLWTEYGSTEICGQETCWPVWEKMFELQFRIEHVRLIRVEIYIIRNQNMQEDLMEQKFVGSAEFNLAEAVYARCNPKNHGWLKKKLENVRRKPRDPPLGKLLIYAEESINAKVELSFQLSAHDLKSTDFWKRKCDPYFMMNRIEGVYDTGELFLAPVYRSEVARKTGEASYEESSYTVAQTSSCDIYQDVIITVHDWFRLGQDRYIGECITTFEELQKIVGRGNPHTFPLYKREGPRISGMTRVKTTTAMLRSATKSSRSGSGSRSGSNSRAQSTLSAERTDSKRKSTNASGEKRTTSRLTARTASQISGGNSGGHRTSSQISGHSRMSHSSGGSKTMSMTSSEVRNQGGKGNFGPLVGSVTLDGHRFKRHYTFLDYLRGGLELQLMVAVDFTRSNLGQTNPKSMHSVVNMEEETAYSTAIRALGEVMSVYDNDKCYPIYGFGAKIPPSHSVVSNCFALTGDFFQPEVEGVEGMLKAYHRALRVCHFHGPSYLSEVIKLAANMARPYIQPKFLKITEAPPDMRYFVLLVLTDGDIEDQEEVVRQIRECIGIPLSVIFVGIGVSQDFKFLRELAKDIGQILKLDGDEGEAQRELALRQLVHFIAFKDHADDPSNLSAATLAHLPRDVVRYYMANGVKPRGLQRFEDKDGNPLPKYIPKEPINSQAVPVKALRIPTGSASGSRDTSKVGSSRTGTNLPSGSKTPESLGRSPADSRVNSKSASLRLENATDEEDVEPWPEEEDSDEDKTKNDKDAEHKLPVYLEEERLRLINNGVGLGYEKFRIVRAIRDGLPSSDLDVLVDNMLHGGYGHSPTYKDAAATALSDVEFYSLPGMARSGSPKDQPGAALAQSRKRIRIGSDEDDEDVDYGERLRELALPPKSLDRRMEGRLGLLPRDRVQIKEPQPRRERTATASSVGGFRDPWETMRVEDGSAARTLLELSASRNESKDVVADRGYPSVARGATKTLEEAAGMLSNLQNAAPDPALGQAVPSADNSPTLRAAGDVGSEASEADMVAVVSDGMLSQGRASSDF